MDFGRLRDASKICVCMLAIVDKRLFGLFEMVRVRILCYHYSGLAVDLLVYRVRVAV